MSGKPRSLKIQGKNVTWQQFKDAFQWDQKSFSLPLHEKLTDQHFNLDPGSKMRNHLAEDVLDDKMLFLMQVKGATKVIMYYKLIMWENAILKKASQIQKKFDSG